MAVAFLKEHLRAVPEPDALPISRHIHDLDSDSFELREKAGKELESFGDAALSAQRNALGNNPSPEVRRRVEDRPHLIAEKLLKHDEKELHCCLCGDG